MQPVKEKQIKRWRYAIANGFVILQTDCLCNKWHASVNHVPPHTFQ